MAKLVHDYDSLGVDRAYAESVLDRYRAQDDSGCYGWTGSRGAGGYGRVHLSGLPNGQLRALAHRLAWWAASPENILQAGMEIRHLCNNRSCTKPNHLRQGTRQENANDRKAARRAPGRLHPSWKLTARSVLEMREMRDAGSTLQFLAEHFGVDPSTVHLAVTGVTWVDAGGPIQEKGRWPTGRRRE